MNTRFANLMLLLDHLSYTEPRPFPSNVGKRKVEELVKLRFIQEVTPSEFVKTVAFKALSSNRTSIYAKGKYLIHYPVGSVVTAVPGTLGIFCWQSFRDAIANTSPNRASFIIRVKPLSEPSYPVSIANVPSDEDACEREFDTFYGPRTSPTSVADAGAVCFSKVKVLT